MELARAALVSPRALGSCQEDSQKRAVAVNPRSWKPDTVSRGASIQPNDPPSYCCGGVLHDFRGMHRGCSTLSCPEIRGGTISVGWSGPVVRECSAADWGRQNALAIMILTKLFMMGWSLIQRSTCKGALRRDGLHCMVAAVQDNLGLSRSKA